MKLRGIDSLDLSGKKVLVRVDFNVPFKGGKVTDTTRIAAHKETIDALLAQGALVTLVSHFGRPKGKVVPELSLGQIRADVEKNYGVPVRFVADCVGPEVAKAVSSQKAGEVLLLENSRFHPEEEKNDPAFSALMAKPFDAFVMDAFSAAHRANSSTVGVGDSLPSAAGFLLQKEIDALSVVRDEPVPPYVVVLGGAKVADKIAVIERMIEKADSLLIGGGMAFTFLAEKGLNVGRSLYDAEHADFARSMLARAKERGVRVLLPVDVVEAHAIEEPETARVVPAEEISSDCMGLDIGPRTEKLFAEAIKGARTVLWNGPMGVFESEAFASGTKAVANALAEATRTGTFTVVGGGDSASAAKKFGVGSLVSHLSTGGGASLEFCEGKDLPAVVPLLKR